MNEQTDPFREASELAERRSRAVNLHPHGDVAAYCRERADAIYSAFVPVKADVEETMERLNLLAEGEWEKANRLLRMGPGDDGSFEMVVATPMFRTFCGLFAELFKRGGAKNYIEQHVTHEELGALLITVQRLQGKSPAGLQKEAERERDEAAARLAAAEGEVRTLREQLRWREVDLDALPDGYVEWYLEVHDTRNPNVDHDVIYAAIGGGWDMVNVFGDDLGWNVSAASFWRPAVLPSAPKAEAPDAR